MEAAPPLRARPEPLLPGALYAAWGAAIAACLALSAVGPWWAPFAVPATAMGAGLLTAALRHPLLNLTVLLALFAASSRNEAGIGLAEVAFAAYYVPYLVAWYGTRVMVYREALVRQRGDLAVVGLLLLIVLGGVLGALGGASTSALLGELGSMSLLAFYFPFREIAERRPDGIAWLLGALALLGVVAVGRNALTFAEVITSAPDLRGIAIARVLANEVLLLFAATAALGGMLFATGRPALRRAAWYAAFLLCSVGVVLTQFRAFFLGLAAAYALAFVLTDGRRRMRLLAATGATLLGMSALAYAVAGELFVVFLAGVAERALSVGTASQEDISFINRFFEYEQVGRLILERPVLGYGFGVEFGFYDAIDRHTWTKPYVHNAYLQVLYKLGVVGLGTLLYVCGLAAARGVVAARRVGDPVAQAGGVFVACALAGLAVAGLASVLFNSDTTLPLALCLAVGAGLARRPRPS